MLFTRHIEKRLETNFDNILEGCQIIGFDWRYLYINKTAAQQGKKSPSELLGQTMMAAYPGIEKSELFSRLRRCMDKRISDYMENKFKFPDGSSGYFELRIEPVLQGVLVFSIDITDRKLAEQKLMTANEKLQEEQKRLRQEHQQIAKSYRSLDLAKNKLQQQNNKAKKALVKLEETATELKKFKLAVAKASDHIVITDQGGRIVYANQAAVKTTGYSIKEMIGNRPSLWGKQMSTEFYQRFWQQILVKKQPFVGEITNKRKNGKIYVAELSVVPIIDSKGEVNFFVSVEHDITRLKEIDQAKTEFVSLASHQLRTPITAISWYLETLLKAKLASRVSRHYLEESYQSTRRLSRLVNELLNVSRLEMDRLEIKPEPVDINKLIKNLTEEMRPLIHQSGSSLKLDLTRLPKLKVDQTLLRQVLGNLLTNALRYRDPDRPNQINVSTERSKNKSLKIRVSDQGIGIDRADNEKIFNRFFRSNTAMKISSEGNGLGLYLAKKLLDEAGCSITFRSQIGQGTTFTVNIPNRGMKSRKGAVSLT